MTLPDSDEPAPSSGGRLETFQDEGDPRASPRHAVQLRVDYKRLNAFFADYAKNISKGGTFIRTDKPLAVGTEFVFVLSIPERAQPIELRGEVMWAVAPGQSTLDAPAGMGIRFKFGDPSEQEALDRFVEGLMTEKLGPHVTDRLLRGR